MLKKDKTIRVNDYSTLSMGNLNKEFYEMLEVLNKVDLDVMLYSDVFPLYTLFGILNGITEEYAKRIGCSTWSLDEHCQTPLKDIRAIERRKLKSNKIINESQAN